MLWCICIMWNHDTECLDAFASCETMTLYAICICILWNLDAFAFSEALTPYALTHLHPVKLWHYMPWCIWSLWNHDIICPYAFASCKTLTLYALVHLHPVKPWHYNRALTHSHPVKHWRYMPLCIYTMWSLNTITHHDAFASCETLTLICPHAFASCETVTLYSLIHLRPVKPWNNMPWCFCILWSLDTIIHPDAFESWEKIHTIIMSICILILWTSHRSWFWRGRFIFSFDYTVFVSLFALK